MHLLGVFFIYLFTVAIVLKEHYSNLWIIIRSIMNNLRKTVFVVDTCHLHTDDAIREYIADIEDHEIHKDGFINAQKLTNCYSVKYDFFKGDVHLSSHVNAFSTSNESKAFIDKKLAEKYKQALL